MVDAIILSMRSQRGWRKCPECQATNGLHRRASEFIEPKDARRLRPVGQSCRIFGLTLDGCGGIAASQSVRTCTLRVSGTSSAGTPVRA